MTSSSNADRTIAAWLTADRGPLDPEVLDVALSASRALRQRHGIRRLVAGSGDWPSAPGAFRWYRLSQATRVALLVALGAALIGAAGMVGRALLESAEIDPTSDPRVLQATWFVDRPDGLSFGAPSGSSRMSLDLALDDASAFVTDTAWPVRMLPAVFRSGPGSEIRFETTVDVPADRQHFAGDAVSVDGQMLRGCVRGDVGRYRWSISADGFQLTLAAIRDDCPSRQAVYARTWNRSFPATSGGGPGVFSAFDDLIAIDLPAGQYEISSTDDRATVLSRGSSDGKLEWAFHVLRDPRDDTRSRCGALAQPGAAIAAGRPGAEAFVEGIGMFFGGGLDRRDDRAIDGIPAIWVSFWPVSCANGVTVLWTGSDPGEAIRIGGGQVASLYFVDRDGTSLVFVVIGPASPDDRSPEAPEAQLIDSVRFLGGSSEERP